MAKLFIAGLGINVESPFSIRYVNIGDQKRTACGILFGYSNGKAIEGSGTINCATLDVACSLDMLMGGLGESYRFDGSEVGSQGSTFNTANQVQTTRVDQFGNTVDVVFISSGSLVLSAPPGMFTDPDCEWSIVVRRYDIGTATMQALVLTGMGANLQSSYLDGLLIGSPPSGFVSVDGVDNELTLSGSRIYHSVQFHKGAQLDPSIAQEMSGNIQESYDDYAGLPFVTMSGDELFKQPFKAKVNIDTIEMQPAIADNCPAIYSTITFSFRQVVPRNTL